jgi:hypothetical protein
MIVVRDRAMSDLSDSLPAAVVVGMRNVEREIDRAVVVPHEGGVLGRLAVRGVGRGVGRGVRRLRVLMAVQRRLAAAVVPRLRRHRAAVVVRRRLVAAGAPDNTLRQSS